MITDFEYLPLFFIVRCSEEVAIGRFYRYLSMQEKLPVASPLYHAIVKSFRLSKRLQECIEWIEINKVYKKYDKKSFLVCKM